MFSQLTAERWGPPARGSLVGPGSYDLPSTLDGQGVLSWEGPERWQSSSDAGMMSHCESVSKLSERMGESPGLASAPTPSRNSLGSSSHRGDCSEKGGVHVVSEKENRLPAAPLTARTTFPATKKDSGVRSPRIQSPQPPMATVKALFAPAAPPTPTGAFRAVPRVFVAPPQAPSTPTGAFRASFPPGARTPGTAWVVTAAPPTAASAGAPAPAARPPTAASADKPSATAACAPGGSSSSSEALARQRGRDLRLVDQLDMVRDELKQKAREAKELHQSLSAKDRKLDELQKKLEELAADKREANRRTVEAESERDLKRRQLHEKDQDLQALQRKNESMKVANEERGKRSERNEEEHRAALSELQRLKTSVECLQERLATSERDRRIAEQSSRQSSKRNSELETGLQAHIEVLEEQLNRESLRRRELEERQAKEGAEREQGETELAEERRRASNLQGIVTQLQSETKLKLAAELQRSEQQSKLEDELCAIKATVQAGAEAQQRSEERRAELERRAAEAEAALEAASNSLAAQKAQNAELEEERQRFGKEQHSQLKEKVEATEKHAKDLAQELADERARCEVLERLVGQHQEKERAAHLAAEGERQSRLADPSYRELEARALRAEAEAEEAKLNLERWKEWGDEQQLRELTAEGERLEKIKEVKEDVTRQVEDARRELVVENRALQQRILELENGPGGSAARSERSAKQEEKLAEQASALATNSTLLVELEAESKRHQRDSAATTGKLETLRGEFDSAGRKHDEQRLQLEEKCRQVEARAARTEAAASVAADEFADERSSAEAKERVLREEQKVALVARAKDAEELLEAEQGSAGRRQRELEQALADAKSRVASMRWQLLSENFTRQKLAADEEAVWAHTRKAAAHWRSAAQGATQDEGRGVRQDLELERLDQENESFKDQNRKVLLSLQLQQQDLQLALVETRRLQEREEVYERDVLRMSERSAELGGHANPKQKIKHLMAVKDENQSLRQELKRAKQSVAQLEGSLRAAQFFEVGTQPPNSEAKAGRRQAGAQQPMTPGRPLSRTPAPGADAADERSENLRRVEKAEQLRHARAHRRASERAANEYQHLYTLVERALAMGSTTAASGLGDIMTDPTSPAAGDVDAEGGGVSTRANADHAELYRRLRRLSANLSSSSAPLVRGAAVQQALLEESMADVDSILGSTPESPEEVPKTPRQESQVVPGCSPEPEEELTVSRKERGGRSYDDEAADGFLDSIV